MEKLLDTFRCPICADFYDRLKPAVQLTCNHVFCSRCYSSTCHICRSKNNKWIFVPSLQIDNMDYRARSLIDTHVDEPRRKRSSFLDSWSEFFIRIMLIALGVALIWHICLLIIKYQSRIMEKINRIDFSLIYADIKYLREITWIQIHLIYSISMSLIRGVLRLIPII